MVNNQGASDFGEACDGVFSFSTSPSLCIDIE